MVSRDVRDKRKKLYNQTIELKKYCSLIEDFEKCEERRKLQRELFKKWTFYNNYIKEVEKEKKYGKTK